MGTAIILSGPSGVGKSTQADLICKKYGYKHINADAFKHIFSSQRSKIRTEIGEKLAYFYARELIGKKFDIVIEAIPNRYLDNIKSILGRNKYRTIEISLVAPLEQCIKNDKKKGEYSYGERAIKEVYNKLLSKRGYVIDVTKRKPNDVFKVVDKYLSKQIS